MIAVVALLVIFQSALPLRGVTVDGGGHDQWHCISIRTPLAGSDGEFEGSMSEFRKFQSALPLRGVTRPGYLQQRIGKFQSALPLRGVTGSALRALAIVWNFNPHSPCGE